MNETKGPEEQLDKTVADTFPASDPPSITPKPGSRKAEQIEQQEAEEMTPKGYPTSDRQAAETVAGRIEGGTKPQQKDY